MDRLSQLLSESLPASPDEAIGGAELVTRLRAKGVTDQEWTDESLRSYFSTLVKRETSVIAKRVGKHGYYLRPIAASSAAPIDQQREPGRGRDDQLEEKFRAVYMAWSEREEERPVHIEHTAASKQPAGLNLWKFPDVVSVNWDVLDEDDHGRPKLNQAVLEVRKSLGEQPFRLCSAELKVEVSSGTLRQIFFQCVSNSRWAHVARLAIAEDILDEALAREVQRLGASYDISVLTFSLTKDDLRALPPASEIRSADQVEAKLGRQLSVTTVVSAAENDYLDWDHIKDMQEQHADFQRIFAWIAKCISDCQPHAYKAWLRLYG